MLATPRIDGDGIWIARFGTESAATIEQWIHALSRETELLHRLAVYPPATLRPRGFAVHWRRRVCPIQCDERVRCGCLRRWVASLCAALTQARSECAVPSPRLSTARRAPPGGPCHFAAGPGGSHPPCSTLRVAFPARLISDFTRGALVVYDES